MAKAAQCISGGQASGLSWHCQFAPVTSRHPSDHCWAVLSVYVQGQIVWGFESQPPSVHSHSWTLVDFLNGLARIWPWLAYEEGYPIDIQPADLSKMMADAEQHWQDLPEHQVEAEDDKLYDFRQRHDLSLLLRGLNRPPLWLLREGHACQVWSPTLTKPVYVRHSQVIESLEALGDALAEHITNHGSGQLHSRAQHALDRWCNRQSHVDSVWVTTVTGLTHDELNALQFQAGKNHPAMKALLNGRSVAVNSSAFATANELQMAARMSRDKLDTAAQWSLLQQIHAIPNVPTERLDQLSQLAPQPDGSKAPYEQGYELANWLRAHMGIGPDQTADPRAILTGLGISPQTTTIPGAIDAVAVWGANHGPAILLNLYSASRASTPNGLRTTLAHEICHLLIDRNGALPVAEILGGQVARKAEQRANAFAAELLLPRSSAASVVQSSATLADALGQIQNQFQVSREVVSHQIANSGAKNLSDVERRQLNAWAKDRTCS